MERLTEWDEYGNADIVALSDVMPEIYAELSFGETNALTDVFNRLAAYEDTGLTPEEIDTFFINGVIEENRRLKDELSRLKAEPNTPLTLEELQEMVGEPVWVKNAAGGRYAVVRSCGKAFTEFTDGGRPTNDKYGIYWLAYRRKPEEGTNT